MSKLSSRVAKIEGIQKNIIHCSTSLIIGEGEIPSDEQLALSERTNLPILVVDII